MPSSDVSSTDAPSTGTSHRRTTSGLLFVGLLALVAVVAVAPAANAHAALLSSEPAAGEAVQTSPAEIRLHFNQAVSATYATVAVVNATGALVTNGAAQADGETVTQRVTELAAGTYTVSYRVVSADGHPISGRFDFGYEPVDGETAQVTLPTSAPTPTAVVSDATDTGTSTETGTGSGSGGGSEFALAGVGVGVLAVGGASLAVILLRRRRSPDRRRP